MATPVSTRAPTKKSKSTGLALRGRIAPAEGDAAQLSGFVVRLTDGDREHATAISDIEGRFFLEGLLDKPSAKVRMEIQDAGGRIVFARDLTAAELGPGPEMHVPVAPPPPGPARDAAPAPALPRAATRAARIIDGAAEAALDAALARAIEEGAIKPATGDWVFKALDELASVHALAERVLGGQDESARDDLRRLLLRASGLEIKPAPLDADRLDKALGDTACCRFTVGEPLVFIAAGFVLGPGEESLRFARLAAGYVGLRAGVLELVFDAAFGVQAGTFEAVSFGKLLGELDPRPFGPDGGTGIPGWDNIMKRLSVMLEPRQQCLSAFLFDLWKEARPLGGDPPPPVLRVEPPLVCVGFTGPFTILPLGGAFPTQDSISWTLSFAGGVLVIRDWRPDAIVFDVPSGVREGCAVLSWNRAFAPGFLEAARNVGAACAPFFRGAQLWERFPFGISQPIEAISVIGPPRITLTADGSAGALTTEACRTVIVDWTVESVGVCSGRSVSLDVVLERDGIGAPQSPQGRMPVTESDTVTYRIIARTLIGTGTGQAVCQTATRTLIVSRVKRLRIVSISPSTVETRRPMEIIISCSCRAGPNGLPFVITESRRGAVVASKPGVVPAGQDVTSVSYAASSSCGSVTISVGAPGYVGESREITVTGPPVIASVTPRTSFLTCNGILADIDGDCLIDPRFTLTAPDGRIIPGQLQGTQPAGGIRVFFPGQPPDVYQLDVEVAGGRQGRAPAPITISARAPQFVDFTFVPRLLTVCSPTLVEFAFRLRFARRLRIIRERDMSVAVDSVRPTADFCSDWVAHVVDPAPPVDKPPVINYLIEAYATTDLSSLKDTRQAQVVIGNPTTPGVTLAEKVIVRNQTASPLILFFVTPDQTAAVYKDTLLANDSVELTIDPCLLVQVVALVPRRVGEHNRAFGTNLDSTSPEAAIFNISFWGGYRLVLGIKGGPIELLEVNVTN